MKPFHLEIVTPDGLMYSGMPESLLLRTDDGDVEIMAGHADFLASLGIGRARILENGQRRYASVSGGFVTVRGGEVKLVATTFEFADDIDVERAMAAKERAERALEGASGEIDVVVAKAKLLRALNRLNISELR